MKLIVIIYLIGPVVSLTQTENLTRTSQTPRVSSGTLVVHPSSPCLLSFHFHLWGKVGPLGDGVDRLEKVI